MNVAFFLTPKRDVVWIPARATMRQALERMEYHRYAAVPVLDEDGHYVYTLTEGDLLWMLKHNGEMSFNDTEHVFIRDVPRTGRSLVPVHIDAHMEDLFTLAMGQNFVPVVDDKEVFIGIVRRSTIIDYSRARLSAEASGGAASSGQDWLCVLDSKGVVSGVEGGAPRSWIGMRLEDCAGVPPKVKDAARKMIRAGSSPFDPVRRRRVTADSEREPSFTLVAMEAIFLTPTPCDLHALVRRALDPLVRQAIEHHVTVAIHSEPLPEAIVDEDKIAWAIATLVGNALRHVRRGTSDMPGGNVRVALGSTGRQGMTSVTVEDDGPGIGAEVQPWLLERNPETGKSYGLALRLVHEIVTAHGGGMVVKSNTDPARRGTAITIWLPNS